MARTNNSIIKGLISVLGGKFGLILTSLVFTPIIVRILGSELYGEYAFAISLVSILTLISNLGFNEGIRKFIAEEPEDHARAAGIYKFYLKYGLISAAFFALMLLIIVEVPQINIIPKKYQVYIPYIAIILIVNQLFQVTRYGLMGMKKENMSESINVGFRIGASIFGIILALYGFDVRGVLVGHMFSALIVGLVGIYSMKLILGSFKNQAPVSRPNLLSFGISSVILSLLTVSLYHTDVLLLGNSNASGNLGFYKSALVVAELIWFVPQAIQIVLVHSSSGIWSEENYSRISNLASTAVRFTIMFSAISTLGIFVLAEEFITLYFGPSFESAVDPLVILLPGVFFFSISRPIFAIGQGKGELRFLIIATALSSILNLVLNLSLIPKYGMKGAAVATTVGYGSMFLFHTAAAHKIGFNPVSDTRFFRIVACTLLTYPVINYLNNLISSRLISILIVATSGGLVFFFLNFVLKTFTRDEISQLREGV